MTQITKTVLYDWHISQGAKMVDFAGYKMPVQYNDGIVKEHLWTRQNASLFDVSHMGQIIIKGNNVAQALEKIFPADLLELAVGQLRYSFFTNEHGTIDDDLMLTKRENDFYLVVNAACKKSDYKRLTQQLENLEVSWWRDRALLALQGPKAVDVLSTMNPAVADLAFMRAGEFRLLDEPCWVSRSGYTGEDGFEISLPNDFAETFVNAILAQDAVKPAGLGARDSLRLEAGLCLYGNDIDATTTPIEAGLTWAIQKSRRPQGEREGGFPGAQTIYTQLINGPERKRVGLKINGRVPVRAHSELFDEHNQRVGEVTSGGFAASLNSPVAMAYVDTKYSQVGTKLIAKVRNKSVDVVVERLPFITKDYKK